MLSEIASQGSTVNSVTTHPEEDILAFGVSLGAVIIASKPTKLKPESKIHCLFKKPATTNPDKNTVDWVSIPQCGDRTNSLFVGIGHLASAKGGVVEEWDLKANRLVANSRPIENGLSCMQVSSDGKLLAAGSGCIVKNDKGDGLIRVFDLANGLRGGINIVTGMHDMEAVSFCPRTKFLFATDSFTSNWSVYDLRFTKEPIFTSTHFMLQSGEVQQNEVVSHCWLKGGDFIATGGHDETLKIWDCNGSFALVDSFTFKSGISQIEYFAGKKARVCPTCM